jgi:hypothetical protein
MVCTLCLAGNVFCSLYRDYIHAPAKHYLFLYNEDANSTDMPMKEQLIETRASVTTVLPSAANNTVKGS